MGRNSIPKHNAITTLGVISVSQMTKSEQLVIFMFPLNFKDDHILVSWTKLWVN